MEPKSRYGLAIRERFCEDPPFGNVLLGPAARIKTKVTQQETKLPAFEFSAFEPAGDEPKAAADFRRSLHGFDRLLALVS